MLSSLNRCALCIVLLIVNLPVFSAQQQTAIANLQKNWDQTFFTLDSKPRKKALRTLIEQAEALRLQQPDNAEFYIWEGIIRASYNEAAGGIGGLRQAKEAKILFEKSIKINPDALKGLAYTELGALYYHVPGWPISFGDNELAMELLLKGLSLNPEDLEAHYLLGNFYSEENNWPAAIDILEKGLALPELSERPAFDEARRSEMQRLLNEAKQQISK